MTAAVAAEAARAGPGRFRLSRRVRRFLRLVHLVAALGWLGVDVALGTLTFTAFFSDSPRTIAACYGALGVFAVPLLLPFGLGALLTGVVLGVGNGVGVLRYWWSALKLGINLVLSALVPILLLPRVQEAAAQSARVDASLPSRLGGIPLDLLFPPLVSGAALVVASLLGTYRPGGRTPYGDRRHRAARTPAA